MLSNHQFGGVYPKPIQQQQRATSAMSNAIHSSGMANKGPVVPYRSTAGSSTLTPTGSSSGKRWGELNRQSSPGKDIWGGTEIPKLKFSGGPAQRSDYWHQMTEQTTKPMTSTTPKMKTDTGGGIGNWMTPQGGFSGGSMFGNKLR